MNSLYSISVNTRRAVFILIIISSLALVSAAQTIAPQQQGDRYGDPGFVGEPINLGVVNVDIRDILTYITEQYGINFVIDKSVGQIPVTVNVAGVPWNVALDSILQSQELGVQVNGPILRIAQSKILAAEGEIIQKQQENRLDTSPLYTEFIRLNYARASGTLTGASGGAGQLTTGVASGSSVGSSGAGGSDQGILGIIQRRLSRRGSVETDGRSNTLIITDVRENIDAVRQLVNLLDQPEPQVEIEARIVVATRNFSRDLGVQLRAFVNGPNGRGVNFGPANPAKDFIAANPVNTLIGLTTGVFGTAQISALISAGETKGQAKTIATPRVTALNNRPAEIQSGTQIPVTTVQPGSGGTNEALVVTTEYIAVPLRLAVTPQITDVGTVILNIVAENSTAQILDSGAPPPISTQSMTTQVMVPDGGTTVIGGVLFDNESENRSNVPGLSKIPILGYLFKQKSIQRTTSELLFFITPRIYRPDYLGNPTGGKVSNGTRSTTIVQPVPLGNPPSNSNPVTVVTANQPQQPVAVPVNNQIVEPKTGVPVTKP